MSISSGSLYSIESNGQDYFLATGNGELVAASLTNSAWQITDCGAGDGFVYIYDDFSNICLTPSSSTGGPVTATACDTSMRVWNVDQRLSSANDGSVSWYISIDHGLWLQMDDDTSCYLSSWTGGPNFEFTLGEGDSVPIDLCSSGNLATAADVGSSTDSGSAQTTDAQTTDAQTTDAQTTDAQTTDAQTTDAQTTDAQTTDYQTTDYQTTDYQTTDYESTDYQTTDDTATQTTPSDTQTTPTDSLTTPTDPGFDAVLSQLSTQTVAAPTIQTPPGATVAGSASRSVQPIKINVNSLGVLLLTGLALVAGLAVKSSV